MHPVWAARRLGVSTIGDIVYHLATIWGLYIASQAIRQIRLWKMLAVGGLVSPQHRLMLPPTRRERDVRPGRGHVPNATRHPGHLRSVGPPGRQPGPLSGGPGSDHTVCLQYRPWPALPAVSPQLHLPVVRVDGGDPAAHHEVTEPRDRGAYEIPDAIAQVDVTDSDVADVTVPRNFAGNKSA